MFEWTSVERYFERYYVLAVKNSFGQRLNLIKALLTLNNNL